MDARHPAAGRVGIDAGTSLWKLAWRGDAWEMAHVPAGAVEEVRRRVAAWSPEEVCVTGGGAPRVAAGLTGIDGIAGMTVRQVSEFAAWARGAEELAGRAGWTLPERYLLVSLGTGTSILDIAGGSFQRVGGTALGGGTLLGLGRLLCGVATFAEIAELAARGERGRVDLLVGDVYPEGGIALPPNLTASNFAKLASSEPADLAHALVGLLGENIGITCAAIAHARSVETVVFGGSALDGSAPLREILRQTVEMGQRGAWLLPDGSFCGAAGAALTP